MPRKRKYDTSGSQTDVRGIANHDTYIKENKIQNHKTEGGKVSLDKKRPATKAAK